MVSWVITLTFALSVIRCRGVDHASSSMTFTSAQRYCVELGPDYGLPRDDTPAAVLGGHMVRLGFSQVWLGLKQVELKNWTWLDGMRTSIAGSQARDRKCGGVLVPESNVESVKCVYKGNAGYICEFPDGRDCGKTGHAFYCFKQEGTTYTFSTGENDWYTARSNCLHHGGQLAIMNNQTKVAAFVRKLSQTKHVNQHYFWAGIRKNDFRPTSNKTGRFLEHAHWAVGEPVHDLPCVVAFLDHQNRTRWRTADCNEMKNVLCIKDSLMLPTDNVSVVSEITAAYNSETNTGGQLAIVFGVFLSLTILLILALLFYIYKKIFAIRSGQASSPDRDAEKVLLEPLPSGNEVEERIHENEACALVNGDSGCRIIVIGPKLSQEYLLEHNLYISQNELSPNSYQQQPDLQLTNTLVHYIKKYLKRDQLLSRKIHLINIIIQGSDMEDVSVWGIALKAAKNKGGHIVYIPATEKRSIPITDGLVCLSSDLAASTVLITDAVYNCDTKHIPFPVCTAMTVGCKVEDRVKTMAWGGLLDFNIKHDGQRWIQDSDRNICVDDSNRPGAIAVATVVGVLQEVAAPGYQCSTRRMRQLLIDKCKKEGNETHDITNRFGEIIPEEILQEICTNETQYEINDQMNQYQEPSTRTQQKTWLRGEDIEKEKIKFLHELHQNVFNTHTVVKIGIIGGGIDTNNELIENCHLEDSRDFTEESESTKDFKDYTTSPTAVLWRMFQDPDHEHPPLIGRNVKFYHAKFSDSENEYQKSSYHNALKWLVTKDVDIIVQFYYMHHLPHPWDGMSFLQETISKKVFITAAYFNSGKSNHLFPSTVAISVGGKHPEGSPHDYSAAGGFLDFIAPL